ncbi:MAG: hypothetical protein KJO76_05580 [Gammaproteobacteria bacterium]|nr:hypothetical protein [Gammaproteobacteria bacterium]
MTTPTEPPHPLPRPAQLAIDCLAALALGAVAVVTANGLGTGPKGAAMKSAIGDSTDLCRAVDDGFLSGRLYGAIDRTVEWRGTDMKCEGGARPGDDGLRLVFAAPGNVKADRLVFVIGISGSIDDLAESERAANVTIIDEKTGRFFSSGRQDRCWTTVTSVDDDGRRYTIGGEVYCSGSLPSLNDGSSVSLSDLRYSGRLTFDES